MVDKPQQRIQLISPVMDKIPGFIVANSVCLECGGLPIWLNVDRAAVEQLIKNWIGDTYSLCQCETPHPPQVVQKDAFKGKTVCICGSGPTLKKTARRIKRGDFDHVWGCNDALIWLSQNAYPVTHGVGIDQSPDLYAETKNGKGETVPACWGDPPDVPYLLATSVDPGLPKHLRAHGRENITHFHSHIGFEGEQPLYGLLYPATCLTGEGLNVVNRAIGVAEFMGYDTIYVAGADCAFGPRDTFHVHGDPVEGMILDGIIDSKTWRTKPDMLVSAISLAKAWQRMGSKLQLLGDTLPNALKHKDQKFWDRCIKFMTAEEEEAAKAAETVQNFAPRLDDVKSLLS